MKLGIIDYGAGNLRSVRNSFHAIGIESSLIHAPDDLNGITHLVFPGVGAFGDCMNKIREQGLEETIVSWITADKPFLGICIGYQALFESSEESPIIRGLGIFRGQVKRFDESINLKIPHMGWNNIELTNPRDPIWRGMGENPYFYYVHSYYPCPQNLEIIAATTTYGIPFAAAIRCGRLVATQFHPEKSQRLGLLLLHNFATL